LQQLSEMSGGEISLLAASLATSNRRKRKMSRLRLVSDFDLIVAANFATVINKSGRILLIAQRKPISPCARSVDLSGAALNATAQHLERWRARVIGLVPYALYSASNGNERKRPEHRSQMLRAHLTSTSALCVEARRYYVIQILCDMRYALVIVHRGGARVRLQDCTISTCCRLRKASNLNSQTRHLKPERRAPPARKQRQRART
jgi:hypothetical protein